MLKHTLLVLVVTVSLLVAVGAVASAEGEMSEPRGEIGVGPTQLLADDIVESGVA
jgi:hypothetical protein